MCERNKGCVIAALNVLVLQLYRNGIVNAPALKAESFIKFLLFTGNGFSLEEITNIINCKLSCVKKMGDGEGTTTR